MKHKPVPAATATSKPITPARQAFMQSVGTAKASPNPSKATSPANVKTTFGVPHKQK